MYFNEIKARKKKDYKILIGGIVVIVVVLLLNLDKTLAIVEKVTGLSLSNSTVEAVKEDEAQLWNDVKGEETKSAETVERPVIDQDEPVEEPPTETSESGTTESGKLTPPFTVMILGDSMALEGFGPQLESKLTAYAGISVVRFGQYSTGLNRIDYYDWYTVTDEYIKAYNPDVLIFTIGANDGQAIQAFDGSTYKLYEDGWEEVYTERVGLYLEYFADDVDYFYWIGQPIPRDTDDFYIKFQIFNRIYEEQCNLYSNCIYVNAWDRFAVNGAYAAAVADDNGVTQLVKAADGVHVTVHGGNILADLVIDYMKEDIEF